MKLISKRKLNLAKFAKRTRFEVTEFLCVEGDAAYATDGHCAFRVLEKGPSAEEFPDVVNPATDIKTNKYLVHPNTASKVLKNLPKNSSLPILNNVALSETEVGLFATTTDLENSVTVKQRPVEEPESGSVNWEEYFPTKDKSLNEILIDPQYLKKIVAAISEFGSNAPVKLSFSDHLGLSKPTLSFSVEDGDSFEVLLMPLRTNQ